MKSFVLTIMLIAAVAIDCRNVYSQTSYTRVVTNDGPAFYWNFDEASGSASNIMAPPVPPSTINDLIPKDGATWVNHADIGDGFNLGSAGSFTLGTYGTCFAVNALTGITNSAPGPWMLEFWMQVQGDQEYQRDNYLMNFGNSAPCVLYDYVGAAQPRDGLEMFAAGTRTGAGPVITDTNFHYILFTYYGDGTNGVADRLDIYVDGTNAAQSVRGTFSSPLPISGSFVVGDASVGDVADAFEGNLDEIAAYNLAGVATNETEVTDIASSMASNHYALAQAAYPAYSQSVLSNKPSLYWNFDQTNGSAQQLVPITFAPFTNNLAPLNGAGRVSHASLGDGLQLGNAATFVKTNGQYYYTAALNYSSSTINPPWLIEFWMQAPLFGQTGLEDSYLMNLGNSAPCVLFDYVGAAQPRDGLEMFGAGSRTGAGPIIADQNWHHVIFADYGDGTTGVADRMDIYVDGTNAAENVQNSFSSTLPMFSPLVVGTSGSQFAAFDGFTGNLDELAIYDWSSMTNEDDVTARVADIAARHFAAAQGSPSLSIAVTNDQIVVSWVASTRNFTLEYTPTLVSPQWLPVGIQPAVANGREEVSMTPGTQTQFFRLTLQ